MIIKLQNEFLIVNLVEHGAELTSIKEKKDNTEYLWTADSAVWARHAPILFPIVGKVKNNEYKIDDITYKLGQHGFARDFKFTVIESDKEKVLLRLSFSEESLKLYPYKFELEVQYLLHDNNLEVKYLVRNVDSRDIYFSIGAHPGFNCPINSEEVTEFDDYYFEFDNKETAELILISKDGLIKREKETFFKDENKIAISKELFKRDALIFNKLKSKKISLKNNKNSKAITMDFSGFPYMGLWSKPEGAPFVCIEPWFGHADYEDFQGDFREKEGVLKLNKGEEFCCKYSISIKI